MPRSLVLCPTRELAAQVAEQFEKYSAHLKLSMALLIGGVSFKDQDKLIDRGVDVLIATPGRLLDHFERGKLMLTGVQIMVVDEADRMLDMGFIPDIERIFKLVPFTRQTLFFSATMAPEITRITQEFLHNPVRVEVARQATTSETIDQFVVTHTPAPQGHRRRREARGAAPADPRPRATALTNGIIFCNRKVDVDIVAKSLKRHGFDAQAMHGDLDQKLRMKILQAFRDGELKLLIASDVAARGLDIPNVSHIFNFDVPIHSEDYVHRIGRTGRAGRSGKSITLCLPSEEKYLAKIEELVKKPIPAMESPLKGERARRGLRRRASRPPGGGAPTAAAAATGGRPSRGRPRAEARRRAPPRRPTPRRSGGGAAARASGPQRTGAGAWATTSRPSCCASLSADQDLGRAGGRAGRAGDAEAVEPLAAKPRASRAQPGTESDQADGRARRRLSPGVPRPPAQAPCAGSACRRESRPDGRRGRGMDRGFDRELEERLLRYAAIDTQSDEASPTSPSTERPVRPPATCSATSLPAIGAQDVRLTDYGTVLATIPATVTGPPDHRPCSRMSTPRRSSTPPASSRSCTAATTAARSASPDAPDLVLVARSSRPTSPARSATTSSPPAARRCSAPTTRPASPSS